ncbi:hypothetical protein OG799_20700 [Micromonospora sp. NBC_00898]|uniref:hypothetical protein n=1 Tax=Micromonospora sp. NBC_00898 TaxID=2975981 RepID=UPI003863EA77|nr:hypothetical protein OG799_20700 [Micromonospora sp. NBC_00898]
MLADRNACGGVAVLLWLYLFPVIVLAGYSATLALSRWRAAAVAGLGSADSRMP